jgi:hypothetical protein
MPTPNNKTRKNGLRTFNNLLSNLGKSFESISLSSKKSPTNLHKKYGLPPSGFVTSNTRRNRGTNLTKTPALTNRNLLSNNTFTSTLLPRNTRNLFTGLSVNARPWNPPPTPGRRNRFNLGNFRNALGNIQQQLPEITFKGINNTGNSCFMNALMQLLISIPELVQLARDYGSIWPCPKCTFENPIGESPCSMCGQGVQPESNNINKLYMFFNAYINTPENAVFNPNTIFDNESCPYFACPVAEGMPPIILNRAQSRTQRITFQQDPRDLLICIFTINSITNPEREFSTKIDALLGHTSYRRQQCIARDTGKLITNTPNPVFSGHFFPLSFTDNFPSDGSIKYLLEEETKIQEFIAFKSIPISANERKRTGYTGPAPNNKTKPTEIDGIPCLDGKYTTQEIVSDPPIAILAINRINFAGRNMRLRTKVTSKCNIDINIIINGSTYILIGFIFHSGTTANGGHYIYYYYNANTNELTLCNDSNITSNIPNIGGPTYVDVVYNGEPASKNAVVVAYRKI